MVLAALDFVLDIGVVFFEELAISVSLQKDLVLRVVNAEKIGSVSVLRKVIPLIGIKVKVRRLTDAHQEVAYFCVKLTLWISFD